MDKMRSWHWHGEMGQPGQGLMPTLTSTSSRANMAICPGRLPALLCPGVPPIQKFNRADRSLPRNYRPTVLLECLGQLLQKSLARRIYTILARPT
jgi:hypothetical protein